MLIKQWKRFQCNFHSLHVHHVGQIGPSWGDFWAECLLYLNVLDTPLAVHTLFTYFGFSMSILFYIFILIYINYFIYYYMYLLYKHILNVNE